MLEEKDFQLNQDFIYIGLLTCPDLSNIHIQPLKKEKKGGDVENI